MEVLFDDGSEPILSSINRKANPNGSVRLVGRNRQIAAWFQAQFQRGDTVQARVLDPHRILLLSGAVGSLPIPRDRDAPVSNEFFYLDENGQRQDADLYKGLLDD